MYTFFSGFSLNERRMKKEKIRSFFVFKSEVRKTIIISYAKYGEYVLEKIK